MPRLMSVALTEDAVAQRIKTVTRRAGWSSLTPGTPLTLVRKAMGRSHALPDGSRYVDPLVRLAEVRVVSVRREPLNWITPEDVTAEGFPDWTPADFIEFFTQHMGGPPTREVNRIEWKYLD
jgi:hypothetical protein